MNSQLTPKLLPGFGIGGIITRTLNQNGASIFAKGCDEYWMEQALQISMNAIGWSAPNPAVGCVILKDQQLLASGFTQAFKHEHAERMAFQALKDLNALQNLTVYVTLEPCSHFGSQPPCVDLLLHSAVSTIVIATQDPDLRVNGAGIQKLRDAKKEVRIGVLEKEVLAWHLPFIHERKIKTPLWVGKWAQTTDGYLANAEGESKWITNSKSRAYTHWLRQKYDAILVGVHTWLKDRPLLTVRDCAEPHRRNPIKLIFDPSGLLLSEENKEALHRVDSETYFYVSQDQIPFGFEHPSLRKIEVNRDDPYFMSAFKKAVESTIFKTPLQSVFCEGGAALLNLLIRNEIISVAHVFTSPKKWSVNDDRYRVQFSPEKAWELLSKHYFEDDCLQEWVKS